MCRVTFFLNGQNLGEHAVHAIPRVGETVTVGVGDVKEKTVVSVKHLIGQGIQLIGVNLDA